MVNHQENSQSQNAKAGKLERGAPVDALGFEPLIIPDRSDDR